MARLGASRTKRLRHVRLSELLIRRAVVARTQQAIDDLERLRAVMRTVRRRPRRAAPGSSGESPLRPGVPAGSLVRVFLSTVLTAGLAGAATSRCPCRVARGGARCAARNSAGAARASASTSARTSARRWAGGRAAHEEAHRDVRAPGRTLRRDPSAVSRSRARGAAHAGRRPTSARAAPRSGRRGRSSLCEEPLHYRVRPLQVLLVATMRPW
jgi:hypothetical protein